MRNRRKTRKILFTVATIAIIIIIATIIAAITLPATKLGDQQTKESAADQSEPAAKSEKVLKAKYVSDTDYKGGDIPYQLYDYPFNRTEDQYTKNKDLVANIPEDQIDRYIKTAEDFTNILFANNYRDVARDTEAFIDSYDTFFPSEDSLIISEKDLTVRAMGSRIAEWTVDNEIESKCEFESDRSLLYRDYGQYHLRAAVTLTYLGEDTGAEVAGLKEMYGLEARYNEPITVMVEVSFVPTQPEYILGYDIIAYIEDDL